MCCIGTLASNGGAYADVTLATGNLAIHADSLDLDALILPCGCCCTPDLGLAIAVVCDPVAPLHSPAPRTCLLPGCPASRRGHSAHQHTYDPAPRPKQDLKELVSAVQELSFLNSSSQVEQTSQLLWCFADWAKQPENRRARMTQAQSHALLALLQHMAVGAGGVNAGEPTHYTAKQLSLSAWSLSKLKPHLPAAAVTSACTALARHSATSEAMKRAGWRDWSNLLHGLATAGMQCGSSPDLTRLCEQAVQLLPKRVARGADGQSISMALWAMAKSGYTGSAQSLLQSVTAAISQGEVMRDAKPQAWANLIWATSKLPGCRAEARQLLSLFAIRAQAVVPGLEAQSISNILYAMSLVMWHHEEVCKQLTERAAQTQQAANGQDLANSLYGLARLGYLDSSVRSLAAGVAKADLAAFTTQAIVNLLYARSMFLALSIHQAVSSGHSQLASEPQLNSMAAALWRECGRRGQGEGLWGEDNLTQLYTASQWLHICTGGQISLAASPALQELVAKALAYRETTIRKLQSALANSNLDQLVQALAAAGHGEVQQAVLSQDGIKCAELLVQGPGLTRGISVVQSPSFLHNGSMSGVMAHAKLQQLTHFDAVVIVNKPVFDQLGSDSERAAFMREQVRASLPEAEAWRQLLLAEGGHGAGQEGPPAAATLAAQQKQGVSVSAGQQARQQGALPLPAAQAKSAGKSVLPSQRASQAPGLLPRPVRPRVTGCCNGLPPRAVPFSCSGPCASQQMLAGRVVAAPHPVRRNLAEAPCKTPLPLYLCSWCVQPGWWRATFQKSPVEVFAVVAGFGKLLLLLLLLLPQACSAPVCQCPAVLQAEAVLVWLWSQRPQGLCLDLSRTHLWQWLAALLLFSFGQALNVGIYKAIGKVGVYYGTRLGHTVPWVTGFPFSVVPHPQYVGSALSVWGVAALLANQLPPDCCGGLANSLVLGLAAFWSLLYAMSAVIESYLPGLMQSSGQTAAAGA
ncbi:hypothetical protein QJQ45_014615 [Haematococcus lacustris]|nr:hypothetical protein QJQ45_014615 [Haematococcus lacustris]